MFLWYLDYLLSTAIWNPAYFGFSVSTSPCVLTPNGTVQICSNPASYLFWDNFHVTTLFHSIMGSYAADVIDSALSVVDVLPNGFAAASHTQSLSFLLLFVAMLTVMCQRLL